MNRLPAREAPRRILPAIVFSQFAATSLWFAGNAVLPELSGEWNLSAHAVGHVTSAVQLGFIVGTLVFAFFAIADRYSPRRIFLACAMLGALGNACIALVPEGLGLLLALRFVTGFFLAGIYPIGMRIAAGWFERDLGRAIGFLVAALVLGTGFPHLLEAMGQELAWAGVLLLVSALAAGGGVLMFALVPDGPHLVKGTGFDPLAFAKIFGSREFRCSAFGYFGHMWELYAFWAFVPLLLAAHLGLAATADARISFWAFVVIGIGSVGCAVGGILSRRYGSARIAFAQLACSGICCLLSPLAVLAPTPLFLGFLVVWGITVVGDSPQFSALNAATAPRALVGSALTIVNCIGFSITIVSIQLLGIAATVIEPAWLFLLLAPGPALGLWRLRPLLRM
ncbi:MAG: MFS transporter [Gammaproteobacteria bacterium]|nr:MFS transporter [Gammaproteobacteria bacterium]